MAAGNEGLEASMAIVGGQRSASKRKCARGVDRLLLHCLRRKGAREDDVARAVFAQSRILVGRGLLVESGGGTADGEVRACGFTWCLGRQSSVFQDAVVASGFCRYELAHYQPSSHSCR